MLSMLADVAEESASTKVPSAYPQKAPEIAHSVKIPIHKSSDSTEDSSSPKKQNEVIDATIGYKTNVKTLEVARAR